MRIGVCGSHGVGKTTVVEKLSKDLGIHKIPEVARYIIDMFGKNPQEMDKNELFLFEKTILNTQITLESLRDDFISDRTICDIAAYSNFLSREAFIEFFSNKKYFDGYDIVFYIPIEFELQKDGVRFEDDSVQKSIDDFIQYYFFREMREETSKFFILTGSIENRFNTAKRVIESLRSIY